MKFCRYCNQDKPIDFFALNPEMKEGRINKCKQCVVRLSLEWRKKNGRKKELDKVKQTRRDRGLLKNPNGTGLDRVKKLVSQHNYRSKRRVQGEQTHTEFDSFVVQEATALCLLRNKLTSYNWHIDHIIPLQHKLACGLHNGFNLQVVPDWWNFKKGNRNMDTFWT